MAPAKRATGVAPLFRMRAVQASRLRWFGPVRVVTPPTWRVAVITAVTVLAMLGVASAQIEIPDRIRTTGVLLPTTGLLKVKSPRAGRIEALLIRGGDFLGDGQPMLHVSGVQNAPGRLPELQERIASLQRELDGLERGALDEIRAIEYRIGRNRERMQLVNAQIDVARAELQTRQAQALLARASADRVAKLRVPGLVAAQVADAAESEALQAAAGEQAARQVLLELGEKQLLIELQLDDDRLQGELLRNRTREKREAIARQISAGRLQSATEVVAPASGVVSGVAVAVGEMVAAGQVLATLHDPGSPLEARLYLAPSDYGRVATGQRVELSLPAYPREIYGTLSAVIESLSPAAVPAHEIVTGVSGAGPVFEIRATLEREEVVAKGRAWNLHAGTTVSADIVRHRWPLYRWFLRSATGGDLRG
jgi:membrane fusion protein